MMIIKFENINNLLFVVYLDMFFIFFCKVLFCFFFEYFGFYFGLIILIFNFNGGEKKFFFKLYCYKSLDLCKICCDVVI